MSAPYAWRAISRGGHPGSTSYGSVPWWRKHSTSYGSVPWWRKQRRKTLCFLLTSQEPGSRQGRCRLEKLVFRLQCSTREASIGAVQLLPHAPDSWGPAGIDGARNAFICFNWRELKLGGVLRGLSGPMGLKGISPQDPPTCASSLSWWGNRRSSPPVWMSIFWPRIALAMALHSMCQPAAARVGQGEARRRVRGGGALPHTKPHRQKERCGLSDRPCPRTLHTPPHPSNPSTHTPGRPLPQGLSQKGSPGLAPFHSAKSQGCRFSPVDSAASPASAAAPTAQGLSLPYVWPDALPGGRGVCVCVWVGGWGGVGGGIMKQHGVPCRGATPTNPPIVGGVARRLRILPHAALLSPLPPPSHPPTHTTHTNTPEGLRVKVDGPVCGVAQAVGHNLLHVMHNLWDVLAAGGGQGRAGGERACGGTSRRFPSRPSKQSSRCWTP